MAEMKDTNSKNNLWAGRNKPVKLKTGKEIKIESIKYDKV